MNNLARILFIFLFLNSESLFAATRRYFVDSNGQRLRNVHLDFGIATSNVREISSSKIFIKLIDQAGNNNISEQLIVSPGICRIGDVRLAQSDISVFLNEKSSISTSEATTGISLIVKIRNQSNRIGVVDCDGFDFLIK